MNIEQEIKTAMRNKDVIRLQVLRALKSEMTNASLRKGNVETVLTEMEILGIIRKGVKQREESAAQFMAGNRPELVEKELIELKILENFLPKPLSDMEIENIVMQAIAQSGAQTKKEMGKAMKIATEIAAGRIDGKVLSTLISSALS